MFKFGSFEEEIAKSMAHNLADNIKARKKEVVKTAEIVKTTQLNRAIDHLNAAAELFYSCGLSSTADSITMLLEKLAHKEQDKPEIIEFESLLHDKKEDEKEEKKLEKELGDQIIQMESIFDKKKV